MENRISGLKCDTDVFVTFEGDNVVMLQVVVRELLARYTKQHQEKPLSPVFRDRAESGSDKLRTSFLAFDVNTVGNLAFLLKAVKFRERALRRSLVARIHYKVLGSFGHQVAGRSGEDLGTAIVDKPKESKNSGAGLFVLL
ncbi:acyl-coenzyme A oxidase-like protein [Lynx rufus]|uniref:acyl-coenzyme A oxidase-like protein n=1 Tax=Lynx rufus TaxID=61384 RepID=UPI001F1274C9|nr:acyl-coenzyme A oxidase-like protein [Lynx rufus]